MPWPAYPTTLHQMLPLGREAVVLNETPGKPSDPTIEPANREHESIGQLALLVGGRHATF